MSDEKPHRKWGKAGERLNGDERDRRSREVRAVANRNRSARLADDRVAYQRWRDGLVCPARITMALDAHSLYGPEVDIACQAREPEVDQWEAAERYPTWSQLVALAALTDHPPRFFTINDVAPLPIWKTSLWFHISDAERRAVEEEPAPVMRYTRAVLDARPASPAEMPETVTA